MHKLAQNSAKESLEMLTDSIFITLKNAMNTGDPATIKNAEEQSRKNIKGLVNLTVAKSKGTLELYSPQSPYTTDKNILKTFKTKKELVLDLNKNDSHFLRALRPMIATQECLMCHANQNIGDVIGVIDLTFSLDEADITISSAVLYILTISLLFGVLTLLVVWFVTKKVTTPLANLKHELNEFFQFLAKEKDTIEPFKIHAKDEIGEMVLSINENIEKTIKGIEQDAKAIHESSIVCEKASKGNLSVNIKAIASNPEINNLTKIVNNLLSSFAVNINNVSTTLDDFSHDKYSSRVNSNSKITGHIEILFEQVNHLSNILTKLSGQNLQNGKALQQTAKIFSKNVNRLASTSNEQANSLKNTSESLNNITVQLQNTTQNSKEMSNYANKVINSSKQGQELATQTVKAIKNINEKVGAINESISVIDQISFQTNILSLNAAVEAATAGEAGKGFAVVAQEVRNLASRSAEAANEIKVLVEAAMTQAHNGTNIANDMITGYETLNNNISFTTKLIESVTQESDKQKIKIQDISDSISKLNEESQNSAKLAQETNYIAQQSNDIAQKIVDDATQKTFKGKEKIKVRKKPLDIQYAGNEKRKIESSIKCQK
jgi:methyl-accepting chemotaxis protein